jgi:hypothetical protein
VSDGSGWDRARVNDTISYHSAISLALTQQRTALESALIPVTAYILVACVECYRRYPEMIDEITAAMPPEAIGRAGHRPGTQIDSVRLWSIPNFTLIGRKVLMGAGLLDTDADVGRLATVFDFWDRAARAYRFDDGTRQAWDGDGVATPYRASVPEIAAACRPVRDDAARVRVARLSALLTSYLFLLWFDTRAGYQDTGPYVLDDGRVMLLRAFNQMGASHFAWSADIAAELPFSDVVAAFVFDEIDLRITDFGTSLTRPDDYLERVTAFGLFDAAGGGFRALDDDDADALARAAKPAQRALYRKIAAMERREKIDAGAYVYFTFLRPFAEVAGITLDWTVPRDSLDLYPLLELIDGAGAPQLDEDASTYYLPVP